MKKEDAGKQLLNDCNYPEVLLKHSQIKCDNYHTFTGYV